MYLICLFIQTIFIICVNRANPAKLSLHLYQYLASELLSMSLLLPLSQCCCQFQCMLVYMYKWCGITISSKFYHFRRNGKGDRIHHRIGDIKIYRESFAGNSIETSSQHRFFCVEFSVIGQMRAVLLHTKANALLYIYNIKYITWMRLRVVFYCLASDCKFQVSDTYKSSHNYFNVL